MFEPFDGEVANAFTYRGVPVRFTYRMPAGDEQVAQVDIDVQWDGDESESRLTRVDGPWPCREDALAEALAVAAKMISDQLGN